MIPQYLKKWYVSDDYRIIRSYSDRLGGGWFKAKGTVSVEALRLQGVSNVLQGT